MKRSHGISAITISEGDVSLRGATPAGEGQVNFTVYSKYARRCTLVLFDGNDVAPFAELEFPPQCRKGEWFSAKVAGLGRVASLRYCYRMEGDYAPAEGHRFDASRLLTDPYARIISGQDRWDSAPIPRRCGIGDGPTRAMRGPAIRDEELIIYELNVHSFTRHPASGAAHPGTFDALREKIPYLKQLGVNCVELMPVAEFDNRGNTWGYSTAGYFAPKAALAASGPDGGQEAEFRHLVQEFHDNGILVFLDVVFNHSPESDQRGETTIWRGLDNKSYYILDHNGGYLDFTGCHNTLSCNSPVMQEVISDALRHWVASYGIDGFRFDLASALTRGEDGTPMSPPPVLHRISEDPALAGVRLIAEPWDAAGLYQLGEFGKWGRWSQWNDRYRDAIRRFVKSDEGILDEVKKRIEGSPDLFPGEPWRSINFVTAHDGFTMMDLVSYNGKHNLANGEDGRDGADDNLSWNSGCEGPSDDPQVRELRLRRIKNMVTLLMLSRGIPMLLFGDECGRSQNGNNNPYCLDDESVWMPWPADRHPLQRFFRNMIAFRKANPQLAGSGAEISWRSERPDAEWDNHNGLSTAMVVKSPAKTIFAAINMHWEAHSFDLPEGRLWHLAVDTSDAPRGDIFHKIAVEARSIAVLTSEEA